MSIIAGGRLGKEYCGEGIFSGKGVYGEGPWGSCEPDLET